MADGRRIAAPEPRRRATSGSGRHRAVKPRYGRIALVAVAAVVTLVAVIGGFGWLPHGGGPSRAAAANAGAAVLRGSDAEQTPSPSTATPASEASRKATGAAT